MRRGLMMVAVLAASGTGIARADDLRARAASDLACKKVKVQDWGAKVEARGCGRNAEYERKGGAIELVMLELEPTPDMRRQVMLDLECSAGEIELTRTFQTATGEILHGTGCAREVDYDVQGGVAKLSSLTKPAPADVLQKIAADLGCPPASLDATVVKDGEGKVVATAKNCKDGTYQRYTLEPFKRETQVVSLEKDTVDLAKRASKDLGCDINKIAVTTETRVTAPGKETPSDKTTVDGCGRRAVYAKKGAGWELSSGPVQVQNVPKQ